MRGLRHFWSKFEIPQKLILDKLRIQIGMHILQKPHTFNELQRVDACIIQETVRERKKSHQISEL